uniref:Ig-like domain-containing protein n=1 Tax=Oncorhynchus mykiss TaxID=8022 RepID=A0A8K9UV55_ONCMY
MKREPVWIWGSLLLNYEQTIKPNQHEVYAEVGSNVLLSCNYSSAYNLLWYKQSPGSAPQYLLLIPHSTGTEYRDDSLDSRFSGKLNEEKTRVDLEISSAEVTDSAMYYCALTPTVTGNPETLYKNLTSPERVFQLCSSRFCLTIGTSSGVNMHPFYCVKRRNILLHITCNEEDNSTEKSLTKTQGL